MHASTPAQQPNTQPLYIEHHLAQTDNQTPPRVKRAHHKFADTQKHVGIILVSGPEAVPHLFYVFVSPHLFLAFLRALPNTSRPTHRHFQPAIVERSTPSSWMHAGKLHKACLHPQHTRSKKSRTRTSITKEGREGTENESRMACQACDLLSARARDVLRKPPPRKRVHATSPRNHLLSRP